MNKRILVISIVGAIICTSILVYFALSLGALFKTDPIAFFKPHGLSEGGILTIPVGSQQLNLFANITIVSSAGRPPDAALIFTLTNGDVKEVWIIAPLEKNETKRKLVEVTATEIAYGLGHRFKAEKIKSRYSSWKTNLLLNLHWIGTKSRPVIYIITPEMGAVSTSIEIPKSGRIVIAGKNYQELRLVGMFIGDILRK